MDLDGTAATPNVTFSNNGTSNTAMTAAQLADNGCIDNCKLTVDNDQYLDQSDGLVVMTESAVNSAVFESFDINGDSNITTVDEATGDGKTVFSYGGDSLDVIITYNDATISMETGEGGDWLAGQTATVTVVDPDLNKNPLDAEELEIGNSTHVIPTIKVGTPLTLAGGSNACLNTTLQAKNAAVHTCRGNVGHDKGSEGHSFAVHNVTDTSERLGFILTALDAGIGSATHNHTWINITTGHTQQQLVDLPGTVVLSYDISGPADLLG